MPNRLAQEPSLYLRQHADNPVDWFPWGKEALEAAQAQDKPLLVSIGYSACHWCHVMAHECFEDPYIAGLMNTHFICVKVDREERPDLDQIYMEAVQMITGRGGWPLNVFCLPDGRPFFGGTYFPPDDRGHGIVPWPQLLMRVAEHYRRSRGDLEENADSILKNMVHANSPAGADGGCPAPEHLLDATRAILDHHDDEWGGFGEAPKFPPSMTLDFLLAMRATRAAEQAGLCPRLDEVITTSLGAMAHGGIFDQIGGGFARYSVDRYWLIPHFEKMLYDNGLLIELYTKAWLRYRNPLYQAVVEESFAWLEREMRVDDGAYAAALDADSDGAEGRAYVWLPDEVAAVLGPEEGRAFCEAYHITERGNFEHGTSNPALVVADYAQREAMAPWRAHLLEVRQQRPQPARDPKRVLSWNALVIKALAEAAFAFDREEWLVRARAQADWLWDKLCTSDGRLYAVYYEDGPRQTACLDDYTDFIEALLALAGKADWLEPGSASLYLARAETLMQTVLHSFRDAHQDGFFFTADHHEVLATRKKEWYDNARPAGNSSLMHSLAQLHVLTGKALYQQEHNALSRAYGGLARRMPTAVAHALSGYTQALMGIVVIKTREAEQLSALRKALASRPWRRCFLCYDASPDQPAGIQVCIGPQCLPPVQDAEEAAELLA